MDIKNTPSFGSGSLDLNNFVDAAKNGPEILVSQDGRQLESLATGQAPGSGRRVDWVKSNEADGTGMFLHALSRAYFGNIADAVAKELGLAPSPGKPLASRAVEQSVDMAQTANIAMDGVNFLEGLVKK